MNNLALSINGMSCGHCLNAVRQALSNAPGVVVDSVRIGRADVQFDPAVTNADQVADTVTKSGYQAAPIR